MNLEVILIMKNRITEELISVFQYILTKYKAIQAFYVRANSVLNKWSSSGVVRSVTFTRLHTLKV